jgi:hypothetical protein
MLDAIIRQMAETVRKIFGLIALLVVVAAIAGIRFIRGR